jgi:hypothetical protein
MNATIRFINLTNYLLGFLFFSKNRLLQCSGTIRGLSMGCMWRVARVSPAGCTSIRIAATLGYE